MIVNLPQTSLSAYIGKNDKDLLKGNYIRMRGSSYDKDPNCNKSSDFPFIIKPDPMKMGSVMQHNYNSCACWSPQDDTTRACK